jgi:tetratricopeptide (TPR) repeat protein
VNRLFQLFVVTWALFHIGWAMLPFDGPFLEWVALALVVVGFWMGTSVLLLRRIGIVRFLLLVAVIARLVFLAEEADLWMFDYYDYGSMVTNPATSWATNVSLLLSGLLLVVAYFTPVADGFEAQGAPHGTRIGAIVAAITRTDGTMITSVVSIVVIVFVVNQFVIGARYAENSPHAVISRAAQSLAAAEGSGNKVKMGHTYLDLGDAYWSLNRPEQAALMYGKLVALDLERHEFSSWALSKSIIRLVQLYSAEPDARFGDGSRALEMAERLPDYERDAAYFDAVAAVYARLGQLDEAIRHEEIAIEECAANGGCCEEHWEYAYHLRQYTGEADG